MRRESATELENSLNLYKKRVFILPEKFIGCFNKISHF